MDLLRSKRGRRETARLIAGAVGAHGRAVTYVRGPTDVYVQQACDVWKSTREQVEQGFLSPAVTMRGVVDKPKFTIQGFPYAATD